MSEINSELETAEMPKEIVATGAGERGAYRQYDELTLIEKIREYRRQRYPDSEIIKMLEMPRRSYYNYVKKMQEQDRELLEEWKVANADALGEEISIFQESVKQVLRRLQAIIDDEKTSIKERLKAIEQFLAASEKLALLAEESPRRLRAARDLDEQAKSQEQKHRTLEEIRRKYSQDTAHSSQGGELVN